MGKGGRPNAKADEALSAHVALRMTEAERLALLGQAAAAGFGSLSQYLRTTLPLPDAPRPRRATAQAGGVFNADDRRALVNLGNNLNQALQLAHSGRHHAAIPQITAAIEKLDAVLDRYLP